MTGCWGGSERQHTSGFLNRRPLARAQLHRDACSFRGVARITEHVQNCLLESLARKVCMRDPYSKPLQPQNPSRSNARNLSALLHFLLNRPIGPSEDHYSKASSLCATSRELLHTAVLLSELAWT
jgi:hypothetical protein